ncbi:hypothetical protein C7S16_3478 [Burkholderia thailandensis]|uniref:Uncharacterized protein n=1 Tax=Burkholderia thailandensis TaxID=57975 RepID=A0AAW9D2U0_BURTH|nr:hypothetical protein [Burkholderia thailandensis]MDW9254589.1 hypothetical protein [Burkholderia thailandensis]
MCVAHNFPFRCAASMNIRLALRIASPDTESDAHRAPRRRSGQPVTGRPAP